MVAANISMTGFRCLYRPDQIFHFADKNHLLGKNVHLDELFKKIDKDAFYQRQVEVRGRLLAISLTRGDNVNEASAVWKVCSRCLWTWIQSSKRLHAVCFATPQGWTENSTLVHSAVDPEHQHKGKEAKKKHSSSSHR